MAFEYEYINDDGDSQQLFGLYQALMDAHRLLGLYEEKEKEEEPGIYETYSALLRAAIILIVAAWETYIEETLRAVFSIKLDNAKTSAEIQHAFDVTAEGWYKKSTDRTLDKSVFTQRFSEKVGGDWKKYISENFEHDIERLNTPSYKNIKSLFKNYLGLDIRNAWVVENEMTVDQLIEQLKVLIETRGAVAHYASDFTTNKRISVDYVYGAIALIKNLARYTGNFLEKN